LCAGLLTFHRRDGQGAESWAEGNVRGLRPRNTDVGKGPQEFANRESRVKWDSSLFLVTIANNTVAAGVPQYYPGSARGWFFCIFVGSGDRGFLLYTGTNPPGLRRSVGGSWSPFSPERCRGEGGGPGLESTGQPALFRPEETKAFRSSGSYRSYTPGWAKKLQGEMGKGDRPGLTPMALFWS